MSPKIGDRVRGLGRHVGKLGYVLANPKRMPDPRKYTVLVRWDGESRLHWVTTHLLGPVGR